jgi:hypothetical protein
LGQGPVCPSVNEQNSIDDEYAPAVFQLNQLLWGSTPSGFMQWQPVAFSEEEQVQESALPCQASTLCSTLASSLPHSTIVQAFFGNQNNFCAFTLTFGAPMGPGYWNQYYLCWALLLGVGFPPVEIFSPLGLGIMAVAHDSCSWCVCCGGGGYFCCCATRGILNTSL